MARKLELNVEGDSASATAALAAAAKEMDRTAANARQMGRAFDNARRDAEQLDRELARNALVVAALAKEYSAADKAARGSIKQRLDLERSAGTELKRIRADVIGDTEKDAKAAAAAFSKATKQFEKAAVTVGADSASAFADGFSGFLESPAGIAALGIGALGAIPVGASIGGATLGAAGLGAAGLAAAAGAHADTSGQVSGATQGIVDELKRQFAEGGKAAIDPLLQGLRLVRETVNQLHIDDVIRTGAKYIEPLAAGAAKFALYLGEGGRELVDKAGPEVKVVADALPKLGQAAKAAFDAIASGSEGGAAALKDLSNVLRDGVVSGGQFIKGTEDLYASLRKLGTAEEDLIAKLRDQNGLFFVSLAPADGLLHIYDQSRYSVDAYAVSLDGLKHGLSEADKAKEWADQLKTIEQNAKDAATAQTELANSMLALDTAELAAKQGAADLAVELKNHKHTLDENTQAGRDNVGAILDQIGKLETLREANIRNGGSVSDANGKFKDQITQLRNLLIQMGFNKAAIDALIAKYASIPNSVTTYVYTIHETQFRTSGQRLTGSSRNPGNDALHGAIRMAEGGAVVAPSNPGTFLFGEPQTGGEAFIPLRGVSQQRAMYLAGVVGSHYGFNVVPSAHRARAAAARLVGGSAGSTRPAATSYTPQGLEALFMSWFLKQVQDGTLPLAMA